MRRLHNRKQRRGIATMELALILPFILVMTMGLIELGTMFYSWMTLQKAAQTGARFATTGIGVEEGTRDAQIVQITEEWVATLDKGNKEVVLRFWPTRDANGEGVEGSAGGPCQLVEVAVNYAYHPFTPLISSLLPEVIMMEGSERKLNEPWKPCE